MENNVVTTRIDFKELIDITDSKRYMDCANNLARNIIESINSGEKVNTIQLPISSDQPENIPFILIQSESETLQVWYSRRSIQVAIRKIDRTEFTDILVTQVKKIFDSDVIQQADIRLITNTLSCMTEINNSQDILNFIAETEYKNFEIGDFGFSFNYFKDESSNSIFSSSSVTYTAIADIPNKKSGILTTLTLMLGGISFSKAKFIDISEGQISRYVKGVNKSLVDERLSKVYGLATMAK